MAASGIGCIDARASFRGEASSAIRVEALQLTSPGSVAGTSSDGCATITVSWLPVDGADDYRIDASVDGGPWTPVVESAGDVSTADDATARASQTVRYRVTARESDSGWTGPPSSASAPLTC